MALAAPNPYQFPTDPRAVWTPRDIAALVCTKMSPDDWRPVTAIAVVLAESGGNPVAISKLNWKPGSPAHLSLDLGLFQLNSYYNTVVDPYNAVPKTSWGSCFDPFAAYDHVWKLINVGRSGWGYNWNLWNTFTSGAHSKYLSVAYRALNDYRATLGLGAL